MNQGLEVFKEKAKALMKPGDYFEARITPSGREVVRTKFNGVKQSAVRYNTGTIVTFTSTKQH